MPQQKNNNGSDDKAAVRDFLEAVRNAIQLGANPEWLINQLPHPQLARMQLQQAGVKLPNSTGNGEDQFVQAFMDLVNKGQSPSWILSQLPHPTLARTQLLMHGIKV